MENGMELRGVRSEKEQELRSEQENHQDKSSIEPSSNVKKRSL